MSTTDRVLQRICFIDKSKSGICVNEIEGYVEYWGNEADGSKTILIRTPPMENHGVITTKPNKRYCGVTKNDQNLK